MDSGIGIKGLTGLWRVCFEAGGQSSCQSIPCSSEDINCGELYAARAFVTLACIVSGLLTVGICINALKGEDRNEKIWRGIKACAFSCFGMGIIGISIGIHETTGDGVSWGPASFLAILSIILNLVGAIVIVLIK